MAQYAGNDAFPDTVDTVNDGTVRDAGSVNVGIEGSLDRTRWLYNRRVAAVHMTSWDNEGSGIGLVPTTTYADFLDAGAYTLRVDVPNVDPSDILIFDASFAISFVANGASDEARMRIVAVAPDASVIVPVGAHVMSGLRNFRFPVAISGMLTAAQTGTYRLKLQGKTAAASPSEITVYDSFVLRAIHLKR